MILSLGLAACESEDVSGRFSPSAELLLSGDPVGKVTFFPDAEPPEPMPPVEGWDLALQLARFGELENGTPSFELIVNFQTSEGAILDFWLMNADQTVAHWQGGPTDIFVGTACFQLALVDLEDESMVMPLEQGAEYSLVADLQKDGQLLVTDTIGVTHFVPELHGDLPGPDSMVFRDLLGCRRVGK